MMTPARTRSRKRVSGEIDVMDLVMGIVLLFLVPVFCVVLAMVFGPEPEPDPYAFRQKPKIEVPPDAEEVEKRWQAAEQLYKVNTKAFLKHLEQTDDPILIEYFRRWTRRCLLTCISNFGDLESWLNDSFTKHPDTRSRFSGYLSRIASLKQEAERDLENVRRLDILGRDEG